MQLDVLPAHDRHRPRGTPRASRRTRWRVAAWIVVHLLVLAHIAHWQISGTTLTPLEPSEAGETLTLGYVNAGFLLFALLVVLTLVFGRFFCGWACHVVAYQDAAAMLLAKLGLRPRAVRSRLLVWIPVLAAVEMFLLPLAGRLLAGNGFPDLALHLWTDDLWLRFPGPGIALLTFFVDGFLLVWLLGAKGFCTYACPYGAVFGVADRGARGRIRVNDDCEGCGHCTAVCTSNVRVHEEVARFGRVVDNGCMKCLDCVDVCPKDALSFSFTAQGARESKPASGRAPRNYDFSWPEELVMAAVFLTSLWVWRGLYDAVPFLLALGLSILAAAAAIALWRLARRRELELQHHVLRRRGRFTIAGMIATLVAVGMLTLTAHGGAVRVRGDRAEALLEHATASAPGAARDADIAEAWEHLDWIARYALVDTADVANKLGSIHAARGENEDARLWMRRAVDLDPSFTASRLVLADIAAREGDFVTALDELEGILAVDPTNVDVGRRLDGLLRRDPNDDRARAMLEGLMQALALEQD